MSHRAYGTVVSILRRTGQKVQLVHNKAVQSVKTQEIVADEMWSFVQKKQKHYLPEELETEDCWIGISLARESGLILSARVGKHTDAAIKNSKS